LTVDRGVGVKCRPASTSLQPMSAKENHQPQPSRRSRSKLRLRRRVAASFNRVIEATAKLGNPTTWATWWQGPVSNVLLRAFENVADTNRALFFRAISRP
jgi:hypothetical protein